MVLPDRMSEAAANGEVGAVAEWFAGGDRDPDERDHQGLTMLYSAAEQGQTAVMRALVRDFGASVDAATVGDGFEETPLHSVVYRSRPAAAAFLLDSGANVDARAAHNRTPLMYAAWASRRAMVRLLLFRNADSAIRSDVPPGPAPLVPLGGRDAEAIAQFRRNEPERALLADFRLAGGTWRAYVREPRVRLVGLRVLCEQGRASTEDALLARLFPAAPPPPAGAPKRARGAYRAGKGGRIPRGLFWHVFGFWRDERDFDPKELAESGESGGPDSELSESDSSCESDADHRDAPDPDRAPKMP